MKKVLIINGQPKAGSFCDALADKHKEGLIKSGKEVKVLFLRELPLEGFVKYEHKEAIDLPPELLEVQKLISWADHLVFAYPVWWATPPALLKVFIEMIFHSGFAYKYKKTSESSYKIERLLSGKSASVILTMDTSPRYHKWLAGDLAFRTVKGALKFCGVGPVRRSYFGSVKKSTESKRNKWLKKVYKDGLR